MKESEEIDYSKIPVGIPVMDSKWTITCKVKRDKKTGIINEINIKLSDDVLMESVERKVEGICDTIPFLLKDKHGDIRGEQE